MRTVYTITKNWRQEIPPRHRHAVMQALGRVMKSDIGKRVYVTETNDGVSHTHIHAQVENMEQFKRRTQA